MLLMKLLVVERKSSPGKVNEKGVFQDDAKPEQSENVMVLELLSDDIF